MLKSGDLQSAEALVNSLTPTGVDLRLIPHSTAHLLDRRLTGSFRFSRGLGEDVYFWSTDVRIKLENLIAGKRLAVASRLPTWLDLGDLVSFWGNVPTPVEDLDVTGTQMVVGELPETTIEAPFADVHSVRVQQVGAMATTTLLVLTSRFELHPSDEILSSATAVRGHVIVSVDRVRDTNTYEVELSAPIEDRGEAAVWYLKCRPTYVSGKLRLPSDIGPCMVGHFMGGALTGDSEPTEIESWFDLYDPGAETISATVPGPVVLLGDVSPTMLAAGRAVEGFVLPARGSVCFRPAADSGRSCLVIQLVAPWPAGHWITSFRSESTGTLRMRFSPEADWTDHEIHGAHAVSFETPNGASVIEVVWIPEDTTSDGFMTAWNVYDRPHFVSGRQSVVLSRGGVAWAGFGPVARKLLADLADINKVTTPTTNIGLVAMESP